MKNLINKIILGLITLTAATQAFATSPARPLKVLECDLADETTYVLKDPFEYIQVKMGDNPSTGYSWYVNAILESSSESHCPNRMVPGCGGTKTFELSDEAIDAQRNRLTGTATFKFRHVAPGAGGKAETFCTIIIKK